MASRRESQRVSLAGHGVRARVGSGSSCVARNLSAGGVFVVTRQRFGLGSMHDIQIKYKDVAVEVLGRVTHIRTDGIGFAFYQPDNGTVGAIRNIIADLMSSGFAQEERRSDRRQQVNAAVTWSPGVGEQRAALRDLSRTGAFISAPSSPPVGTEIMIYLAGFTYSGGKRIASEARGCSARVVRREAQGFAVAFLSPSAEFSMAVAQMQQAPEPDARPPPARR